MFNEKTHDIMRKLQLIFAAAAGALGVLSSAIDLGQVGVICTTILAAAGYFVGQLAESDSKQFFDTRTVVDKIVED